MTRPARFTILLLLFASACGGGSDACAPDPAAFRDGDIIFHRSTSAQADALERALDSPYTRMGMIFIDGGELFVYETVGPVKRTPPAVAALRDATPCYEGKPYDSYFEWSDERIYCYELAWKAYQIALGLEIGALTRFGDHDLTDPLVRAKLPLLETVTEKR